MNDQTPDSTDPLASPTDTIPEAGEEAPGTPAPPAPPPAWRRWAKLVALLGVVALLIFVVRYFDLASRFFGFAEKVNALGVWAPVVYVVLYALATIAFIPGSLLTLAAGAIFGLGKGAAVVFVGATLGSCGAFLVSRYLARGAIERRLEGNQRFAAMDRAIGQRGFFITMLLRLSPVFPFNMLNYGLGLTKVRFRDYALASVGMIPGTFLFVYYGVAAGDLAKIAEGGAATSGGAGDYVVKGLGLAATIVVTVLITRTARRALKEATDGPADASGGDTGAADAPAG